MPKLRYIALMALFAVGMVYLIIAVVGIANAQRGSNTQTPSETVAGLATSRSTVNASGTVATGLTFQQILPSVVGNAGSARQSVTIQNNNSGTDACYLHIGTGTPSTANSILLAAPSGSYQRYWPMVPSDAMQITCTTTGDTFYVDTQ